MKNFVLVLGLLVGCSSYAAEVKGLKCSSLYVQHQIDRTYHVDKVNLNTSMFGYAPVLDSNRLIKINNRMKSFSEQISYDEQKSGVKYVISVGQDISTLDIMLISKSAAPELIASKTFNTLEGITVNQSLMGKAMITANHGKSVSDVSDVIVSCHPAY